jgi:hypothetical protein
MHCNVDCTATPGTLTPGWVAIGGKGFRLLYFSVGQREFDRSTVSPGVADSPGDPVRFAESRRRLVICFVLSSWLFEDCSSGGRMEIARLAMADRHIAEGNMLIADQLALIDRLRLGGADTSSAERLLRLFRDALAEWNRQRDLVLRTLN